MSVTQPWNIGPIFCLETDNDDDDEEEEEEEEEEGGGVGEGGEEETSSFACSIIAALKLEYHLTIDTEIKVTTVYTWC